MVRVSGMVWMDRKSSNCAETKTRHTIKQTMTPAGGLGLVSGQKGWRAGQRQTRRLSEGRGRGRGRGMPALTPTPRLGDCEV